MNQNNKGIFLQQFYGVDTIPDLTDTEGNPTKFAEAAKYWDEPIPASVKDVKMLVAKGAALTATENLSVTQKFSMNAWYGGKQELSLERPNKIKVPFVKTGAWKHDIYGEVKFTEDDITQLVDNFKKDVVGFKPYLTLGHLDEEPESTDSHRKRGDLQDIVIENDVAYGIFDVNDDIYNSIQRGEYEYSSGEFNRSFTSKDDGSKVGTAVIRVALTNSPFLPFGNDKIQALSDKAESCPETNESCVFLLSIDAPKQDVSEPSSETPVEEPAKVDEDNNHLNLSTNTEPTMENQTVPVTDDTQVAATPDVTATAGDQALSTDAAADVTPAPVEPKAEEAPAAPVASEGKNVADVAITNLTSQLAKVESLYKSQIENAQKTIEGLTSQLAAITEKLNGQTEITQAFSASMSQAQERNLINTLQANNVQPAVIQQFLSLKKAFETSEDKAVVKLSVQAGEEVQEVQKNVMDGVAELLVAASKQTPVVEQQLGISSGRKTGAFDFSGIIERNSEAAKKTQV